MRLSNKYGGLQFFAAEPSFNGGTWLLNETIDLTPGQYISTDIVFVSNHKAFSNMTIKGNSGTISYDDTVVWSYGWNNLTGEDTSVYRTVTFATVPTGDLLTWLQANGTKQGGGEYNE